jgi:hypothetical protein
MTNEKDNQLELAGEFVLRTNRNVFLTGKAGTGKTTFLHNLKKITPKRMVVVAPTGVAAINAGGVTIHSFFQISFGPQVPGFIRSQEGNKEGETGARVADYKKFSREKIRLIQSLDLLVIDEISMVRADLLDAIDETLRKYKDRNKPFGGTQLLMIGDLHQLSPVVKDDEWDMLKEHYDSVYFFSSKAYRQSNPVTIELKYIFRQSDQQFIDLLNRVRNNEVDDLTLEKLNQRFVPGFRPKDEEGYITLTTHNAIAHDINQARLKDIKKKSSTFTAIIEGDFPSYSYPTEKELELKVDAQVMFVKNDGSFEKLYYNGKIGKIKSIGEDMIYVSCPNEPEDIPVERAIWTNMKYSLDENTKEIKEHQAGSFKQFPLKLAWAITIHKSQGLTFDKAIIDANAAFAFGQVYVALSRCRSFEGLVLSTRITPRGIKTDATVSGFTEDVNRNNPGQQQLADARMTFQRSLLNELFDFNRIRNRFNYLKKLLIEHGTTVHHAAMDDLTLLEPHAESEIYKVSDKFMLQIDKLSSTGSLPEDNAELQERVKKACAYFNEKLEARLYKFTRNTVIETDNKLVKKSVSEALENLQKDVFIKLQCFKSCMNRFESVAYMQARANGELDYRASLKGAPKAEPATIKNIPHPDLYKALKQWRDDLAEQNDMPAYMVLPQKTLVRLLAFLPVTPAELVSIKGMGERKVQQFGEEITEMIARYCAVNNIERQAIEIVVKGRKKKLPKPDTKKQSFELYKTGKTIEEIAKERSLAVSTISGHLAYFIGTGELDVHDLVSTEKIDLISKFFTKNPSNYLYDAKTALGESVTYNEVRFVHQHLEYLKKENAEAIIKS